MGLVSRTAYADGNTVTADGQNTNEEAIVTQVNGNIENVNCSSTMALDGTKLADAPNGVPTIKINDLAVTENKLAAEGVTAAKIKNLTITGAKIATGTITEDKLAPSSISISKLKGLVAEDIVVSMTAPSAGNYYVAIISNLIRSGANYNIKTSGLVYDSADGHLSFIASTQAPVTAIPYATKQIISVTYEVTSGTLGVPGALTVTLRVISADRA